MAETGTQATEPQSPARPPLPFRPARAPVAVVATAFAAGVLADRYSHFKYSDWILLALVLALTWIVFAFVRWNRIAGVLVVSVWIAVGGMSHHSAWSVTGRDDVFRRASEDPSPTEFVGTIVSRPSIRPAEQASTSVLPPVDRTQCIVEVTHIVEGGALVPSSGKVQLIVAGHLPMAQRGDTIRVRGQISRPRPPGNPGEFDYREFLRRKGILSIVRAEDPDAVRTVTPVSRTSFQWVRNRARWIAGDILYSSLDADVYPIAAAILLGDRDYVTTDLRESFTESGTMHLLAISGLHVGILALFLWRIARLLHFRLSLEVATVIAFVMLYVLLTDVRPSVLRAGVLVMCLMGSRLWFRRINAANSLGIAGLVVLLLNPTDLFDVGAQLSFLAVIAIAWTASNAKLTATVDEDNVLDSTAWRVTRFLFRTLLRDMRVMFVVTAITAPLVAYAFHLYAPIGLAINVVLIHLVFGVMIAGYSLLLVGYFVPAATVAPAVVFSAGLRVLQGVAETAASFSAGHHYGPGPSLGWVLTFYSLFGVSIIARDRRVRHYILCSMLAWVAIGLAWTLPSHEPGFLRCTFLDVGHGSSILIETPQGRTLLVDIGSMDSSKRATRAVQGCLWERGFYHLDTLAITHADLDHFNGAPKLLEETTVGSIVAPQTFVDSQEPGAIEVRETARAFGTPLQAVQRGQPMHIDSDVTISVLHPGEPATSRFEDDNASSLVLLIEYAGRRVLLTGDVSGSGQRSLLSRAIPKVDVLLAPHHGGKNDNTIELKEWARPSFVVASSRRKSPLKVMANIYPDAEAYLTARDGAVSCVISPDGRLTVTAFRTSNAAYD